MDELYMEDLYETEDDWYCLENPYFATCVTHAVSRVTLL